MTIADSDTGSTVVAASVANSVEPDAGVLLLIDGWFGGRTDYMVGLNGGEVREIHEPAVRFSGRLRWRVRCRTSRLKPLESFPPKTFAGALQPMQQTTEGMNNQGSFLIFDAVTSWADYR